VVPDQARDDDSRIEPGMTVFVSAIVRDAAEEYLLAHRQAS
jgi:hypothetical protein